MKSRISCTALLLGACALLFPSTEAKADTNAILGEFSGISPQFGTLDLNTGVFTQTGASMLLAGFGETGGTLYAGAAVGDTTYTVDPASGDVTSIGTGTIYDAFGSTTSGLFAIDVPSTGSPFVTYSVDPTTGAATLLGSTGVTWTGSGTANLSVGDGTLYWTWTLAGGNSELYSINTTTGAATLIGNTGTLIDAMAFINGTMYGVTNGNVIDTLNLGTGLATSTGVSISGLNANSGAYGLAPAIAATPEPSSVLLLIPMIAAMMSFRLRTKRS